MGLTEHHVHITNPVRVASHVIHPRTGTVALSCDLAHHPFRLFDPQQKQVTDKSHEGVKVDASYFEGAFFFDGAGRARFDCLPVGQYKLKILGLGIHDDTPNDGDGYDPQGISLKEILGDGVEILVNVAPGKTLTLVKRASMDATFSPCCGVAATKSPAKSRPVMPPPKLGLASWKRIPHAQGDRADLHVAAPRQPDGTKILFTLEALGPDGVWSKAAEVVAKVHGQQAKASCELAHTPGAPAAYRFRARLVEGQPAPQP